eukprot:g12492.t1
MQTTTTSTHPVGQSLVALGSRLPQELSVSLSEIKGRPASTQAVLMACAGTGRMSTKHRPPATGRGVFWTHVPWGVDSFGCAKWTGCSLAELLREAGLKDGAKQVIFTGADKGVEAGKVQYYQRSLSVEDALRGHVMLVYEMNGEPLKPAHGFPLRLIVPGWYGMASVKWLTKIEVVEGPWWGHQMEAYSFRRAANDPERVPLTQLPVRALMAPPGVPDFFSRTRVVEPGTQRITGKVWAGAVDIERVEVSCDHGKTGACKSCGVSGCLIDFRQEKNGVFGWANWYYDWQTPGEGNFVLMCRGFDKKGRSQDSTSDEAFNWTGMGDTQPQMVYVRVDSKIQDVGNQINLIPETRAAKKSLNDTLLRSWRSGEHSDWTLTLGDHEFKVHKVIVATGERASAFLAAAFRKHVGDAEEHTDLTALLPRQCWPHFEAVLDFIYSDKLDIQADSWGPLVKTASRRRKPRSTRFAARCRPAKNDQT